MEPLQAILSYLGSAASVGGLLLWFLKRFVEKLEKRREEKERNKEELMLMIMHTTRANNVLATATARAVQRIPDAHCNGDMKRALEEASRIQKAEKDFLINQGLEHIFET